MKLYNKTESWSNGNEEWIGKYKGFKCEICYSSNYYEKNPYWYFLFTSKEDKTYNSLRENKKYKTKEECHDACIEHIVSTDK